MVCGLIPFKCCQEWESSMPTTYVISAKIVLFNKFHTLDSPNHPGPESIDTHITQVRNCRPSHRKDKIQHYCMLLLPSLHFCDLNGCKLVFCATRLLRAFALAMSTGSQSGDWSHSLKILTSPSQHFICWRCLAFLAFHKQWMSLHKVTNSGR